MLREAAPIVAPSLCRLINLSLRKLIFPSEWKKSNVTPIYKSGNATDCNNYRPISLISCAGQSWRGWSSSTYSIFVGIIWWLQISNRASLRMMVQLISGSTCITNFVNYRRPERNSGSFLLYNESVRSGVSSCAVTQIGQFWSNWRAPSVVEKLPFISKAKSGYKWSHLAGVTLRLVYLNTS